MTQKKHLLCYVLFAALGTVATATAGLLDTRWGNSFASLLVKSAVFAVAWLCLRRSEAKPKSRWSPWIWTALVPVAVQAVMSFAPVNRLPSWSAVASVLVSVLLTVLWEETGFRGLAVAWFDRDGAMSPGFIVLTSALFGAAHLVNVATMPWATVAVQAVLATAHGAFLLGLTRRTRRLLPAMVTHFALNAIPAAFALTSTKAPLDADWLLLVQFGVTAVLAVFVNKKKRTED